MGLLTDPHTGRGRLVKFMCRFHVLICILLYTGAVVWLGILPHSHISMSVHFSENALLPGLVKTEFSQETIAKDFYEELIYEMKKYKDSIPYPWLIAKFRQIGLDTYSHNFTLNYPLGKTQTFTGNNVYGILRAARAASTEAVILSVPYRPPSSIHPTTAPAIGIMLAFAKYANQEKYWAKDIIFLVTEHEQLGVQAWLEAYHGVNIGHKGVLDCGDLRGRAGQIQAAINLEVNDLKIAIMDIKIEGLNGQLPNLDLVTLVNKMCIKEGLHVTFKNRGNIHPQNDKYRHWRHSFTTMMSMILSQSTGIPTGNHGLYHRFGIQAVTMHGFLKPNSRGNQIGFFSLGKILEGIFRSLNNLLERFHQSYFFYLLPSNDRFISIIWFIPVLCLLVGTLLVRSLIQWYQVCYNPYIIDDEKPNRKSAEWYKILLLYFASHVCGVVLMNLPLFITFLGAEYGYNTDMSLFYGFGIISVFFLIVPYLFRMQREKSMVMLNLFIVWELAMVLLGIGMINFSLGVLLSFVIIPVTLLIVPTDSKLRAGLQTVLWFFVHPFVILNIIVMIYTVLMFPSSKFKETFAMGVSATKQALVFSIVDSIVYGNWLFDVACCVFLPIWLCMCCLIMSSPFDEREAILGKETKTEQRKEKTE